MTGRHLYATEESDSTPTIRSGRCSFIRMVLPLSFKRETFDERYRRIIDTPGDDGRKLWEPVKLMDEAFLPHIRRHLNRTSSFDGKGFALRPEADSLGCLWRLNGRRCNSLHLATDWHLSLPKNLGRLEDEITFEISGANLALFRPNILFAMIDVEPQCRHAARWFDAIHYLRFYGRRSRELWESERTRPCRMADLMASIISSVLLDNEVLPRAFRQPDSGTTKNSVGGKEPDPFDELCTPGEMLVYSSLYVDGAGASIKGELLARVRGVFHSLEEVGIEESAGAWLVPYRKEQQFVLSIECSSFVAFDADDDEFRTLLFQITLRKPIVFYFCLCLCSGLY